MNFVENSSFWFFRDHKVLGPEEASVCGKFRCGWIFPQRKCAEEFKGNFPSPAWCPRPSRL